MLKSPDVTKLMATSPEDYQPQFECFLCGEKCPTHGDIACHLVLKCMKTRETYCKLCDVELHVCI